MWSNMEQDLLQNKSGLPPPEACIWEIRESNMFDIFSDFLSTAITKPSINLGRPSAVEEAETLRTEEKKKIVVCSLLNDAVHIS